MNKFVRPHRGKTPNIASSAWVDETALVIGDTTIGEDSSVWPMAVVRGDMHKITIGRRVSVQDGAVLHITHAGPFNPAGYPLTIGNDVTIGHQACLHGCTIGSEVLIGIGAKILDGAVVEDQIVVGAGTLVPPGKRLESGHVYMGSPAKKIRALSEQELKFFKYTAANYVKLKDEYQRNC